MKWEELSQYEQSKYIDKAQYLVDKGLKSGDVYDIAKKIYEKSKMDK